jgi:hypothetical protein
MTWSTRMLDARMKRREKEKAYKAAALKRMEANLQAWSENDRVKHEQEQIKFLERKYDNKTR